MKVKKKLILVALIMSSVLLNAKPTRIVLTWTGDPATSQTVTWRTPTANDDVTAQCAPLLKHTDDMAKQAQDVPAITEKVTTVDGAVVYHHSASFTSLKSSVFYAYRVNDGTTWSEWNRFRTADSTAQPFKFIYLGDVQNNIYSAWSILARSAFTKAPDARFMLYAGDLVNRGKNDNEWHEFFDGLGFISRMMPALPVPGNHDASKEITRVDGSRAIDPLYLAHFDLPKNGPPVDDLQESAYYLDYQGVRFVALNTNSYKDPDQLAWLEETLASSTANWTIVFQHHPLFSTGSDRNARDLRNTLMPVFQRYKVDLVLQGHDHRYGRTNKILDGETVADDREAPVYVVSVSGPKKYAHNANFAHLMQVEQGETQCYQVISVEPEQIRYEAWSLDDKLFDAFVLRRKGNNTILENLR